MKNCNRRMVSAFGCVLALVVILSAVFVPVLAADHGDGPTASNDAAADIADAYFFRDPNDNTKIVLIGTFHGFIVPAEAVNFGIFDPTVRYRFEIENTGDAKPDKFISITFDRRVSNAQAQMATIVLPNREKVTALATNPSLAGTAPAPVITDVGSGVSFFAGEVDDPFFFDIPGFNRFVASVLAGTPDPTRLDRGRNSFAGYNIMAIALSMPAALIKGDGDVIGMDFLTQRRSETPSRNGETRGEGGFRNVDRTGNPAINVALVPFARKNEYNAGNTRDDARGHFADSIVGTLTALGTSTANITALANIAVTNGDFLRLDVTVPNTGSGGGDNVSAAFPNGRRLKDDVIDIALSIITNGAITTGDHADANDVPFRDIFPFLAAAQQPREGVGNVDDNTRN